MPVHTGNQFSTGMCPRYGPTASPRPHGHPKEVIAGTLLPPSFKQRSKQTRTHTRGVSIIYHWLNPELTHWAGGCAGQPEAAQHHLS